MLTGEETEAIELKSWIDSGSNRKSPTVERLWIIAVTSNDAALMKRLLDATRTSMPASATARQ
jgi:hypothetical protein